VHMDVCVWGGGGFRRGGGKGERGKGLGWRVLVGSRGSTVVLVAATGLPVQPAAGSVERLALLCGEAGPSGLGRGIRVALPPASRRSWRCGTGDWGRVMQ
jgi:hypothetical protein